MGLFDGLLGHGSSVDPSDLAKRLDGVLSEGERVSLAFRVIRDVFVFTDKRLILIDVQGMVTQESWTDRTTGEERRGVVLNVERYEVILKAGQGQQAPPTQARPATSAWAGAAPAAAPAPKAASAWGGSAADDSDAPF